MQTLQSIWIWVATAILVVVWLPLLAVVRLSDRDPALYRTGRWFRRLGVALTKINPLWKIELTKMDSVVNPRHPYVVVCNHQSLADIPLVSCAPWEMKWMGKAEIRKIPLVYWMLRLAGDILVDRSNARSGVAAILKAKEYLEETCSVFIFPEGTRSPDGRVHDFADGAFVLALKAKVPVLVLALDGTSNALRKNSWKYRNPGQIRLTVVDIVDTSAHGRRDVAALREHVRSLIVEQVAQWRGVSEQDVDADSTTADPPVAINSAP